jgi:hypothetical protein
MDFAIFFDKFVIDTGNNNRFGDKNCTQKKQVVKGDILPINSLFNPFNNRKDKFQINHIAPKGEKNETEEDS